MLVPLLLFNRLSRFTRGTQRLTTSLEGINRLTNLDLLVKKIHSPTEGQNVNSKFSNMRESYFFRFRMAKYVIRNTKKNRLAFS